MIEVLIAHATELQLGFPGPLGDETGIPGIIQNVYVVALGLAGALALGSIIYGAVMYSLSKGNPSKLSDAWDRILQAFIGVLLLVGAGTLLSIVNPGLLNLQLPSLGRIADTKYVATELPELAPGAETDDAATEIPPASPTGKNTIIEPTESCKKNDAKCVTIPTGRDGFRSCATKPWNRCRTHENIMRSLTCAASKSNIPISAISFSTGYPAGTYKHKDPGHINGCSADIFVTYDYMKSCSDVNAFIENIYSCGGAALNEYAYLNYGKDFRGCGKVTAKANGGNHIHVYGCPPGTQ